MMTEKETYAPILTARSEALPTTFDPEQDDEPNIKRGENSYEVIPEVTAQDLETLHQEVVAHLTQEAQELAI